MILKYKVYWSPSAYEDFQKIYNYIRFHLKEKITANNISKLLLKSISNLSYFPEKYSKIQIPNYKFKNIRKMQIKTFVIIYEVCNNTRSNFYFTYFS